MIDPIANGPAVGSRKRNKAPNTEVTAIDATPTTSPNSSTTPSSFQAIPRLSANERRKADTTPPSAATTGTSSVLNLTETKMATISQARP